METSIKTMIIVTAILTIISVVTKTETASLFVELPKCPEITRWQDKLECEPRYLGHINLSCKEGYYPCETSSDEQKVLYTRALKTESYRKDFCCRNLTYSDDNNGTTSSNSTEDLLEDVLRRVSLLETYLCTHCAVISPILQFVNYGIFIATLAISIIGLLLCLKDRFTKKYHGVLSTSPTLIVTERPVSAKQRSRRRAAIQH